MLSHHWPSLSSRLPRANRMFCKKKAKIPERQPFKCKKLGHIRADCPLFNKDKFKQKKKRLMYASCDDPDTSETEIIPMKMKNYSYVSKHFQMR